VTTADTAPRAAASRASKAASASGRTEARPFAASRPRNLRVVSENFAFAASAPRALALSVEVKAGEARRVLRSDESARIRLRAATSSATALSVPVSFARSKRARA